jgi:hypothetical protein
MFKLSFIPSFHCLTVASNYLIILLFSSTSNEIRFALIDMNKIVPTFIFVNGFSEKSFHETDQTLISMAILRFKKIVIMRIY